MSSTVTQIRKQLTIDHLNRILRNGVETGYRMVRRGYLNRGYRAIIPGTVSDDRNSPTAEAELRLIAERIAADEHDGVYR